ncbi:MAG: amidohydrolase family protein, partial [Halanaeroarchaeum sp.]
IFVDGVIHVHPGEGRTEEALAVRDGTVCRVADTYEVEFLEGIETRRVDLDGRTVVPGFVDGYADLATVGQQLLGTDDGATGSPPADVAAAREYLTAAVEAALKQGITTVFDAVRHPETARAYHELALSAALPIRVGLNYRGDLAKERPTPLEAVNRLGLVSGAGTDRVWIDSLAVDAGERSGDALREFLESATEAGFRVSATVDGPTALDSLLTAMSGADATRPRIWLDEAIPADRGQRLAALGATVVGRPESAAGEANQGAKERGTTRSAGPQFGRLLAAGVPVSFGSNGRRPNPLRDVERATTASPDARLGVTEALRAATGAAAGQSAVGAGLGTLEVGTPADFVALADSPWETPIAELAVELTVVDGTIEYDRLD